MALIEGVGDEVLQFFLAVFLIILAFLAWWSTQISERPLIRTVLILERRGARQTDGEASPPPPVPPPDEKDDRTGEGTTVEGDEATRTTTEEPTEIEVQVPLPTAPELDAPFRRPEEINRLRNRRLAFFNQGNPSSEVEVLTHNDNLNQLLDEGLAESVPLAHEEGPEEEINLKEEEKEATQAKEAPSGTSSPDQSIRIRLKYLNDDLKLVDGKLEEQLGDFKKRHFNLELSGRKLVRLIFNGQVLVQDSWTLRHYGLFDNCVVHCLVHQPRTPPPSPNLNTRPGSQRPAALSPWALSNVLLASFSLLLGLAWYGRYQYAQLYTATTTVALVGLTGIFTVSLIGLYMPDLQ